MFKATPIENRPGWTDELFFLSQEDPEWDRMFKAFVDPVMLNNGERLQYMGTVVERYHGAIKNIRHEFRHRCAPSNNERKYWAVPGSPDLCFRYVMRDSGLVKFAFATE